MRRAARLYHDCPSDPELPNLGFALDSSLIALSLKLFNWAFYHRFKRALKLHVMLSLQAKLPAWAAITEGTFADMKILDQIPIITAAARGRCVLRPDEFLLDQLRPDGRPEWTGPSRLVFDNAPSARWSV